MIEKQTIRDFIAGLTNKTHVDDDDSLLTSKLLDSLNIAVLISFLEEQNNITIDGDDVTPENLDSINAIAQFLSSKVSSQ